MNYEKYINKIVKITTKDNYYFNGRIKEVEKEEILILDKYGKDVIIKLSDIKMLVET